ATGINFLTAEVAAKRLELLRELVPAATRVGVLINPDNATSTESTLKDVTTAAKTIGLQIQLLNARTSREINAAFEDFVRESAFFSSRRVQLVHLATRHAVPAYTHSVSLPTSAGS